MHFEDSAGRLLADHLISLAANQEDFARRVGTVISEAIDHVLDGEASLDDLEGCEKTYIGTKVEKRFLKSFGLPRKTKVSTHRLDTVVADLDLDLKFTLGSTWMIPPEAVGHWCLLIRVDVPAQRFAVGLLRMDEDNLTKGGNRDGKRSVSKAGRERIAWLVADAPLVPAEIDHDARFHAIAHGLTARLLAHPLRPLDADAPTRPGVYAIYHGGHLVYIGKTTSLHARLRKHRRTLQAAERIDENDCAYRCLPCDPHLMVALESWLIAAHDPAWNSTGFGSNAHGSGRQGQRQSVWNQMFGREVTR